MLTDDHKKFVELTVDGIASGVIKLDFDMLKTENGEKLVTKLNLLMISWIDERKNQNSLKFVEMTEELYKQLLSSRFSQMMSGEVKNNDIEIENKVLKDDHKLFTSKIIKLEAENQKLHDENLVLANELEDLKNIVNSYESASLKK